MGCHDFNSFRYGLATLLLRRPFLRQYSTSAHKWRSRIETYGELIRMRDSLRSRSGSNPELRDYERLCEELESDLQWYLGSSPADVARQG